VSYSYTGEAHGAYADYSFNPYSSFLPWVVVSHQSFHESWTVGCETTKVYAGSARGLDLSCSAPRWAQSGSWDATYPYDSTRDCAGKVSPISGRWPIGGMFTTRAGGVLHVSAGWLTSQITPPCADEAIGWQGDTSTGARTRNLYSGNGSESFSRDVVGTYGGGNNAHFHSTLVVSLDTSVVWSGALAQWLQQIGQYVTDLQDFLHWQNGPPAENPGEASPSAPTVFSAQTGGLSVTVQDEDPVTLFSLHQRVRAGVPTRLNVRLTATGRRLLASSPDPARLRIKMRFTPSHARAVRLTKRITAPALQPVIDSVQFDGSPANPTIVVRGQGLGRLPPADPAGSLAGVNGCPSASGNYGHDYGGSLSLVDATGNWAAGRHLAGNGEVDCVGITPTKFSSGEVDFGLGSFYTQRYPHPALNPGDDVQIVINGAFLDVHVAYGVAITS
jgi:hypothetical protein